MASSGSRADSHCSACGAPIPSVESERCKYCGAPVNTKVAVAKAAARHAENATKKAWRYSWIYIAVFVGISVVMGLRAQCKVQDAMNGAAQGGGPQMPSAATEKGRKRPRKSEGEKERLYLHTLLATHPEPDGTQSILATSGSTPNVAIYLIDAATGKVRWKNAPWRTYLNRKQIVLSGDKLFVVDQERLVALNVKDGAILWQASLVADYASYTEGFRVSGDRIAVLVRDGSTQCFDANTGQTVWTHKQTPPPNKLPGAGNRLLEFRRVPSGRRKTTEIAVVDMETGDVRQRLRPRCSTHSIIPPDSPDIHSSMLFAGDGQELYLFYGTFRFCAERWNLTAGAMAWQTNQAKQGQRGREEAGEIPFVVGEDEIFYPAEDKAVYAIRRSTGQLRRLIADPDNLLAPVLQQGKLVVVAATAGWEGQACGQAKKCMLWGVDREKGAVLWRYALPPDPVHGRRSTDERFQGRFVPEGLSLVQASGDQLVLDLLDLGSGVSRRHKQIKLSGEIREMRWQDDLVWLHADAYEGIDPANGTVRYRLE